MKLHLYEMTVAFVKNICEFIQYEILYFYLIAKGICFFFFCFFRNRETPGLDSSYNTICQLTNVGFLTWLLHSWKTGDILYKWYNGIINVKQCSTCHIEGTQYSFSLSFPHLLEQQALL